MFAYLLSQIINTLLKGIFLFHSIPTKKKLVLYWFQSRWAGLWPGHVAWVIVRSVVGEIVSSGLGKNGFFLILGKTGRLHALCSLGLHRDKGPFPGLQLAWLVPRCMLSAAPARSQGVSAPAITGLVPGQVILGPERSWAGLNRVTGLLQISPLGLKSVGPPPRPWASMSHSRSLSNRTTPGLQMRGARIGLSHH